MALASWRVQIIKRSDGKSAVAAAAYRSALTLYDEYTGRTHSYAHKRDVIYTEILAPAQAPAWVYDPDQLWNRAGSAERQSNAQTAREVRIALPCELTPEQNIELARSFGQVFVHQGMIAHVSVHDKRDGNPHAHIMLTMRPLDGDSFSTRKNRDWNKTERLLEWHKEYERLTNQYLERYGHEERIDIRSYAEQEIDRIPTIHLGAAAHRMEQRGIQTERGDINRHIAEQNKEIAEINRKIEACEKEAEKLNNEIAQEEKRRQVEFEKEGAGAQERSQPGPASTYHNRLLKGYVRVAQSLHKNAEALQDILTEKGIQDFAGQEKTVEDVREPLQRQTPEPETPFHHTMVEESEQKRQKQQDYDALYDAAKQIEHYRRAEQAVQDFVGQEKTVEDVREPSPQQTPEPETPFHYTWVEESERKRQKQQDYDALYDAAKQKRKEHRLVRDTERQNRRYQNAYKQAEEREKKIGRIEQTTHHGWPETPKPERQPDFQEKYKIAERRHHELERRERRYSRSRDDPEHEK